MYPEKTPPPIPAANASARRSPYAGCCGSVTTQVHPTNGISMSRVESTSIFLVPTIGGRVIHTSRRIPPDRPGIASNQYDWVSLRFHPVKVPRVGTSAPGRYQMMNARTRLNVVTHRVDHATLLFQLWGQFGSQFLRSLRNSCRNPTGVVAVVSVVTIVRLHKSVRVMLELHIRSGFLDTPGPWSQVPELGFRCQNGVYDRRDICFDFIAETACAFFQRRRCLRDSTCAARILGQP
jgi:hypothetical protein